MQIVEIGVSKYETKSKARHQNDNWYTVLTLDEMPGNENALLDRGHYQFKDV